MSVMRKQVSTTSTTAMLGAGDGSERDPDPGATDEAAINGAAKATSTSDFPLAAGHTVIPIREEFRCRRFWFFYHDIRSLATSVRACTRRDTFLNGELLFSSDSSVLSSMKLRVPHELATCSAF